MVRLFANQNPGKSGNGEGRKYSITSVNKTQNKKQTSHCIHNPPVLNEKEMRDLKKFISVVIENLIAEAKGPVFVIEGNNYKFSIPNCLDRSMRCKTHT